MTDSGDAGLDSELPSRRDALKAIGASLAMAGLAACTRQPRETIVPYARTPESALPGRPRWFATSMPWPTGALGLLVESHQGRPTKIEGNPDHPASRGATDAIAQAQVFGLYDPDRSKVVLRRGRISTWAALLDGLRAPLAAHQAREGAGLRILTETVTSPTLASQLAALLHARPQASWHQFEPVNRDRARAGALLAFGRDVSVAPQLETADVVVAIDCDFLGGGPGSVRLTQDFARRRRVRAGATTMNRLYVVEGSPSLTGAMADHRLVLRPAEIAGFARALDEELRRALAGSSAAPANDERARFVHALAQELVQQRGTSLLLVGERQPAPVHWFAHHWNAALGNVGRTLTWRRPVAPAPVDQLESLRRLVADMRAGAVELLVILGGNPAYSAPADLDFAEALAHVPLRLHLGLYADETAHLCDWHLPESHFLESWSDALAADGTAGIVQPLIAPLWGGHSPHELAAVLQGDSSATAYDLVRAYWKEQLPGRDFEPAWRRALHVGAIEGTAFPSESAAVRPFDVATLEVTRSAPMQASANADLELEFRPDHSLFDGRFANNGALQELPRPLTKLTWDNAALVSPVTAELLGVKSGEVVEIHQGERSLRAPVFVLPGQADGCITLPLGYGRSRAGRHGSGVGFDAGPLIVSVPSGAAVRVVRTANTHDLATTQEHDRMEGRDLVRAGTLAQFLADPHGLGPAAHETAGPVPSLFPPPPRGEHAWGMVIDLGVCTGCNACMLACQAENNIPVVGKEEVARGHALHWIRVDRYFEGDPRRPQIRHQPIPCMHCENAPCEVVCPVGATVHGAEGLNEMVYNRCVGTRYCANNCPYKVRRFNYFAYTDESEPLALQRNPDVTVRTRGVMEKCTYCVQRINAAHATSKREGRGLRDGDVVTACQAACPASAIIFGDLQDADSAVARLQEQPHRYGLLEELGTRPRTTYLARVNHPNPEL